MHGEPCLLDFSHCLGQQRSTGDRGQLDAFKEISTLALRFAHESLLRFGEVQRVMAQFFHVYEEEEPHRPNFHMHTLIMLT